MFSETRISFVRRFRQIIQMIVAERQRQRRLAARRLQKSIARLLKALEKELSSLDEDIDAAVRGSPSWREKEDLLASVPGAGPVIARTLIAELPELGQLGRKEIAALAGLAPWTRRSGMERQELHRRRQALRAGGSVHGRSRRVAVTRKLLTILNAVVRDKRPWRDVDEELAHAKP